MMFEYFDGIVLLLCSFFSIFFPFFHSLNRVLGSLPPSIGNLTLTNLLLSGNSLRGTIPDTLGEFRGNQRFLYVVDDIFITTHRQVRCSSAVSGQQPVHRHLAGIHCQKSAGGSDSRFEQADRWAAACCALLSVVWSIASIICFFVLCSPHPIVNPHSLNFLIPLTSLPGTIPSGFGDIGSQFMVISAAFNDFTGVMPSGICQANAC